MFDDSTTEVLMSHDNRNNGDDLVIEVSVRDPGPRTDENDLDAARRREMERITTQVRRNTLILRVFDFLLHVGLLIGEQMSFRHSWAQECDFDIKVWATVWLAAATARSLLQTLNSTILFITEGRPVCAMLFKQPLLELFGFVWFVYGIVPLFASNEPYCNSVSAGWALFGWSLQALTFFLPCILVLLCVPCVLCMLRVAWVRNRVLPLLIGPVEPSTNQQPTPEEILSKLNPTTFGAAVRGGHIDLEPYGRQQPHDAPSPSANSEGLSLIHATLPESFSQAVNSLMTRLNSNNIDVDGNQQDQLSISDVARRSPNIVPAPSPHGAAGTLTCPICVTEFTADDEILLMPCDPRRHVFHSSCIREWLRKSQHCPMCRTNIVSMIGDHETQHSSPV